MRKTFAIVAVAVVALMALVAAGESSAATPVTRSILACYEGGGNITVPAGSDVTLRVGWSQSNAGLVQDFLANETTTATLDGSPLADASARWSGPQAIPPAFVSVWLSPDKTLANSGDKMVLTMQISLRNRIPQGVDPDTGMQIFAGPGEVVQPDFGCTVTAV